MSAARARVKVPRSPPTEDTGAFGAGGTRSRHARCGHIGVVGMQVECGVGASRTAVMPARRIGARAALSAAVCAERGLHSRCHKAQAGIASRPCCRTRRAPEVEPSFLSLSSPVSDQLLAWRTVRQVGAATTHAGGARGGSPCRPAWSDSIKRRIARSADRIPRPRPRRRGIRTPADSAYGSSHVSLRGSGVVGRSGGYPPAAGRKTRPLPYLPAVRLADLGEFAPEFPTGMFADFLRG